MTDELTKAGKQRKREARKGEGRPKIPIDWKLFDELCLIGCTLEEICSILKADNKTLEKYCKIELKKSFSDYFQEKSAEGKRSLRRQQTLLALGRSAKYDENNNLIQSEILPNTTMLIWLGKQRLGQSDKQETKWDDKQFDIRLTLVKGKQSS